MYELDGMSVHFSSGVSLLEEKLDPRNVMVVQGVQPAYKIRTVLVPSQYTAEFQILPYFFFNTSLLLHFQCVESYLFFAVYQPSFLSTRHK